ncbi:NAD(P)H-dependent flavin oxidoreductase [Streptacidiphilus cavernicola]|uniref:NAD(P)H-dependent flavin oxidoreductase n=1 Tax=Streptacidiphilus cavernicola TaxID=3342716 RepID=A0ABV6W229_9ACTN
MSAAETPHRPEGAAAAWSGPAAAARAAAERGAAALGVDFPLVQAGMGGVAGPELAAAVADSGALGTVALYKSDSDQSAALVADTAARTRRGFGVNVIPEVAGRLLADQIGALLVTADRPLVLNSYGMLPEREAVRVLAAGHRLLIQVGSAAEAADAAALGAHAIALQGVEAGGHHLGKLTTRQLLGRCGAAPAPPLLVAGAVAGGADLFDAMLLGACGAVCGTPFVATAESSAHPDYKAALVRAEGGDTVVTDRFSIGWPGRPHRVLRGAVTDAPQPLPATLIAWTSVMGARRPVPRGSAAAPTAEAEGQVEQMAQYAGLGCGALRAVRPAAAVVAAFRDEFAAACGSPSPDAVATGAPR